MKFCCSDFEGSYYIGNQFGINIRIVKFNSKQFASGDKIYFSKNIKLNKTQKKRDDIRFFMTMGYEKFSLNMALTNIAFCPFCGTNLYDFYVKDEYANEIEHETFNL
jgi:hypothetical protein